MIALLMRVSVSCVYALTSWTLLRKYDESVGVAGAFFIFTTSMLWFNIMSRLAETSKQRFWVMLAVFGALLIAACLTLRNDTLILTSTCVGLIAAGCWAIWANKFCEECVNGLKE